ncbi:acetyltransferase [Janibacter sp. HTCC2649]|uniref:GNAT family N-acetyltransferase n=1 Tax=Janibacter sp. HTCC2649 TaxID=313589 RepID=UPI0000670E8B|nr:GNAT family N-acetyltransferase [Janibacter sp. HTCC2649]EAP97579.1 acetyltransferase [Janibacter sp. HTCC2649]
MPFPDSVPILTDGVVRLRAHNERDVDRIVEQCTDSESVRWTQVPRGYTVEMAREWIPAIAKGWDEGGDQLWAIEEITVGGGDGLFLGTIDLRPRAAGRAEIGYGLHPEGRGRGLMARALKLVCQYWFDGGGQRVDWYAERGNFASWGPARAAGFDFLTTLPEHAAHGEGGLVDAWFGTLGREDAMEPRAAWITPPVLEADGIRLRPWRAEDGASAEATNHPSHFVPAGAIPTPETWDDWLLRRRLVMARGLSFNWCIADATTDEALGEVLVFVHGGAILDSDTAELGYYLFPRARGRGAAKTASRLAVQHTFTSKDDGGMGLRRLVAETAADNAASNAILASVGFTKWGHEAAAQAPDGSIGPADHWELLRP